MTIIYNLALLENVFHRESKMQDAFCLLHLEWNVMPVFLYVSSCLLLTISTRWNASRSEECLVTSVIGALCLLGA
jgi:hypothetical protein